MEIKIGIQHVAREITVETESTAKDVEANLEMKEKALARLEAPDIKLKRFRAGDELMRFLQTL